MESLRRLVPFNCLITDVVLEGGGQTRKSRKDNKRTLGSAVKNSELPRSFKSSQFKQADAQEVKSVWRSGARTQERVSLAVMILVQNQTEQKNPPQRFNEHLTSDAPQIKPQ